MSSSGDDSENRAKAGGGGLETSGKPSSGEAREQGRERDPAEVLRMWPCSTGMLEDRAAVARAASPEASGERHGDDELGLAHFALDLYREIEDLQMAASGADLAQLVHPAYPVDPAQPVQPLQRDAVAVCDNPNCEVRINQLRSALVEACLLAQRIVTMMPAANGEVEGRIRELLKLIEP